MAFKPKNISWPENQCNKCASRLPETRVAIITLKIEWGDSIPHTKLDKRKFWVLGYLSFQSLQRFIILPLELDICSCRVENWCCKKSGKAVMKNMTRGMFFHAWNFFAIGVRKVLAIWASFGTRKSVKQCSSEQAAGPPKKAFLHQTSSFLHGFDSYHNGWASAYRWFGPF